MIRIRRSTVIEAPIEEVWHVLRDFNSHKHWHPGIADSRIEDRRRSDQVGCVRDFRLADGAALREQLLSLSDQDHTLRYCILDAPLPLDGYVAMIRLKPVTNSGNTFWEWSSQFRTPPGREAELSRLVAEGIYDAGFQALREHLLHKAHVVSQRTQTRPSAPAVATGERLRCKAVIARSHGGPEVFAWQDVDVPPPGPGQVRLRHTAIGVNFIDIYCRTGYFDLLKPPGVLGMEAAGVITDVGAGVSDLAPGDRVAYACSPLGAYAELRTMDAQLLVRLPEDIDDRTAAAALLKGMTAEFLLHRVAQVSQGQTVLVHAAAGGVGQLLCQWASALGATVIGTVGSMDKARIARQAGCAHTIVYSDEDFAARMAELTAGRGADVVFDAVGRDTLERSFQALATCGHLVSFGQASGPLASVDIASYARKSATISRPNFAHYTDTPEKVRAITGNLFRHIRNGTLRVHVWREFPLERAADAHRALEGRATSGPVILIP